ncbi:unnamed protein product [Schistocephalus solidus]|uniref:Uncharacterized protein n=1 Tax=Schistocephalus solidus TaxID=70667 RepID=A0A3P7CDH4_SCHSO|nr:unnamed protein product [Schistocephalus solidus]
MASAGLCSRPEARLTGRAGNQGDPQCRWLDRSPPRHLPDEAPTANPTKAPSKQINQKLEELHASDYNASVETRWCQLLNVIQSTALEAIYGPCIKETAPLLSSDGTTLLTEKSQILKRWVEYFRSFLHCSSAISDAAIDRLPQVDTNNDLHLPPSLPETTQAAQQISSGKAPGSDEIPPEVYKQGRPHLIAEQTTLFQNMWKIFARILLNRLNGHLEHGLLPESQCGFCRHRGTTDMIFAARQLQEKCQEMRTHLNTTFVDLTKAFDTVNRDELWKVM